MPPKTPGPVRKSARLASQDQLHNSASDAFSDHSQTTLLQTPTKPSASRRTNHPQLLNTTPDHNSILTTPKPTRLRQQNVTPQSTPLRLAKLEIETDSDEDVLSTDDNHSVSTRHLPTIPTRTANNAVHTTPNNDGMTTPSRTTRASNRINQTPIRNHDQSSQSLFETTQHSQRSTLPLHHEQQQQQPRSRLQPLLCPAKSTGDSSLFSSISDHSNHSNTNTSHNQKRPHQDSSQDLLHSSQPSFPPATPTKPLPLHLRSTALPRISLHHSSNLSQSMQSGSTTPRTSAHPLTPLSSAVPSLLSAKPVSHRISYGNSMLTSKPIENRIRSSVNPISNNNTNNTTLRTSLSKTGLSLDDDAEIADLFDNDSDFQDVLQAQKNQEKKYQDRHKPIQSVQNPSFLPHSTQLLTSNHLQHPNKVNSLTNHYQSSLPKPTSRPLPQPLSQQSLQRTQSKLYQQTLSINNDENNKTGGSIDTSGDSSSDAPIPIRKSKIASLQDTHISSTTRNVNANQMNDTFKEADLKDVSSAVSKLISTTPNSRTNQQTTTRNMPAPHNSNSSSSSGAGSNLSNISKLSKHGNSTPLTTSTNSSNYLPTISIPSAAFSSSTTTSSLEPAPISSLSTHPLPHPLSSPLHSTTSSKRLTDQHILPSTLKPTLTTLLPSSHSSLPLSASNQRTLSSQQDYGVYEYQSMSQYDYNQYDMEPPSQGVDFAAIYGSIHLPNTTADTNSNVSGFDRTDALQQQFSPKTSATLSNLAPKPSFLSKNMNITNIQPNSDFKGINNTPTSHHPNRNPPPTPQSPSTTTFLELHQHQQQLAQLHLRLPTLQYHQSNQQSITQPFSHPPAMTIELSDEDTPSQNNFISPQDVSERYQLAVQRYGLEFISPRPKTTTAAASTQTAAAPISLADKLKSRQKNRLSIVGTGDDAKPTDIVDNVNTAEGNIVNSLQDFINSLLSNTNTKMAKMAKNTGTIDTMTDNICLPNDYMSLSQIASQHLSLVLKTNPSLSCFDKLRSFLYNTSSSLPNTSSLNPINTSSCSSVSCKTMNDLGFSTNFLLQSMYKQFALQLLRTKFKKPYPLNTISLDDTHGSTENENESSTATTKKNTKNRRLTGNFGNNNPSKDTFLHGSQNVATMAWHVPKKEPQILLSDLQDLAKKSIFPSIQDHNFQLITEQQQRIYLPTLADQEREFSEKNPHFRSDSTSSNMTTSSVPSSAVKAPKSVTKAKKTIKGGNDGDVNQETWKDVSRPGDIIEHFIPYHQTMIQQEWNPVFITEAAHTQKWSFLTTISGGGPFPSLPDASTLNYNYNVTVSQHHHEVPSLDPVTTQLSSQLNPKIAHLQSVMFNNPSNPLSTQTIPSHYFSPAVSVSSEIILPTTDLNSISESQQQAHPDVEFLHRAPAMPNGLTDLSKQYSINHLQHNFTPIPIGTSAMWESIQPKPLATILPFTTNEELRQLIYRSGNTDDDEDENVNQTNDTDMPDTPKKSTKSRHSTLFTQMFGKFADKSTKFKDEAASLVGGSVADVIRPFLKFFNLPTRDFRNPLAIYKYYQDIKKKFSTPQRVKFSQLQHQIKHRLKQLNLQHRFEIMGQQYIANYIKPTVMNVVDTIHMQSNPQFYSFDQYVNFVENDSMSDDLHNSTSSSYDNINTDDTVHNFASFNPQQASIDEDKIQVQLDESRQSTYMLLNLHPYHAEVVGMSHEIIELIPLSDIQVSFEQMSDPYYQYHKKQQGLKQKKVSINMPSQSRRVSGFTTPTSLYTTSPMGNIDKKSSFALGSSGSEKNEKRRTSNDLTKPSTNLSSTISLPPTHPISQRVSETKSSFSSTSTSNQPLNHNQLDSSTEFSRSVSNTSQHSTLNSTSQHSLSTDQSSINGKSPRRHLGNLDVSKKSGRLVDSDNNHQPDSTTTMTSTSSIPPQKHHSHITPVKQLQGNHSSSGKSSLSLYSSSTSHPSSLSVANSSSIQSRPANPSTPINIQPPRSFNDLTTQSSSSNTPSSVPSTHQHQHPQSGHNQPQSLFNTIPTKRNARASLDNLPPSTPQPQQHQHSRNTLGFNSVNSPSLQPTNPRLTTVKQSLPIMSDSALVAASSSTAPPSSSTTASSSTTVTTANDILSTSANKRQKTTDQPPSSANLPPVTLKPQTSSTSLTSRPTPANSSSSSLVPKKTTTSILGSKPNSMLGGKPAVPGNSSILKFFSKQPPPPK